MATNGDTNNLVGEFNDIRATFAALCRQLTAAREINFASDAFRALNSNAERTKFAHRLLEEFKLFPQVLVQSKSDELSSKCRQEGNALFAQKRDEKALNMYSKSVALAQGTSDALGLAYANRSAVLLERKRFSECLQDIELALNHNYPERLKAKLEDRRKKVLNILSSTKTANCSSTKSTQSDDSATNPTPSSAQEEKPRQTQSTLNNDHVLISSECDKTDSDKYFCDNVPTVNVRNDRIECAGAQVEIRSSPDLGRHVVATETIHPGDVIAVERPYITILLQDNYYTHCYHCLRPSCNLLPCTTDGGCVHVMFCSSQCRNSAWNSYHRYECPILATLLALDVGKLTLLALKVVLQARDKLHSLVMEKDVPQERGQDDSQKTVYKSGRYEEIHCLIANADKRTMADLFERSVTAAIILKLLQDETALFEDCNLATECGAKDYTAERSIDETDELRYVAGGLLLLHLQTAPSNMHEVSELFDQKRGEFRSVEIGAGAYSFLSMLNHDCSPNVVRNCYGTTIVLRALRTIHSGEQIMDNYGYHHAVMSVEERRQHLQKQYHFPCRCNACRYNWPLFHDLKTLEVPEIANLIDDELQALKRGDRGLARSIIRRLLKNAEILQNYVDAEGIQAPPKNYYENQETMKQCFAIFGNKRCSL